MSNDKAMRALIWVMTWLSGLSLGILGFGGTGISLVLAVFSALLSWALGDFD